MSSLARTAVILALGMPCPAILRAQTVEPADQPSPSCSGAPADGRRTLGRFGANLGRNFVGVFSSDNVKPFLIGASATGAGAFLDDETESFFARHRVNGLGDVGDSLGARYLVGLTAGLFVTGRFAHNGRFRAATYDMTQAALIDAAYFVAIKYAVRRERPDGSNRLSFPSGHTANAVALATAAARHYGPRVAIPAYLIAGFIGVSRIERQAHHLSDVLAGATLGYVVGRTVVRRDAEPLPEHGHLALTPAVGPSGTGAGLTISLVF